MSVKFKKGLRIFFISLHILIVAVFLVVALVPWIDPGRFWFVAVLGLGYVFLTAAVVLCLLISLVLRSKWALLPFLALVLSWKQVAALVSIRSEQQVALDKDPEVLRVFSWNVSSWTESKKSAGKNQGASYREEMLDVVRQYNPDVVCFQEFFESYNPKFFPSNIAALEQMGFRYHHFTPAILTVNKTFRTGLIIMSKFPITDTGSLRYPVGRLREGLSYADVKVGNRTVRFFNTHLMSLGLHRSTYVDPTGSEFKGGVLSNLKRTYTYRKVQVDILRQQMDSSPHPVILCGDLNDVPNSYTYFKARGPLRDAFVKKGSGFGRTFKFISPTIRIDYILYDPSMKVKQFAKLKYNYSDHYPQVADLSFED